MVAYYNEHDPFAAAWLRELIAGGHIAPGDVDERSIVDVRPVDLAGYGQCHFFAGIGGWSLALRLAGWPDDRSVWTGSCPCQPWSGAGRGDGASDERHLWPTFFDLIRERRPFCVVGEQVASKAGLEWLDLVRSDMEAEGYAVGAADLCAAGFGAPHIRQRLWWVGLPCGADGYLADTEGVRHLQRKFRHCPGSSDATQSGHGGRRSEVVGVHGAVGGGADGFWSDVEWLPCRDGKRRPAQSGIFPLVDGLSDSLELLRVKGLLRGSGNAIVPQAAAAWIEAVMGVI